MGHYRIFDARPPCITLLKIHINTEVGALVWPQDIPFHYPYRDWSHYVYCCWKVVLVSKQEYKQILKCILVLISIGCNHF
jgi:hypothetical protein